MSNWCVRSRLAALTLLTLPARAAEHGGQPIVLVVDSRTLSGWMAWWANVYNEGHWYFTLLTITIIPVLGLVMGRLTGFVLARLGINLKSRVLAEH